MPIHVYKYPQVMHLTLGYLLPNCERHGVNMIVSQHYTNSLIKVFRSADQRIDMLLKDFDRRPVKFEEYEHLWFKLYDGDREILEVELALNDFDRGWYFLDLTAAQTASLRIAQYSYCIVVKDTVANTTRLLYTNQDYGAASPLQVYEGPLPALAPAQDIDPTELTGMGSEFVSSALVGAAQVNNPQGIHSLVLTLEDYTGTLTVQGCLDTDIPVDFTGWAEAHVEEFTAATGTVHLSITGNYNWVRLIFSPTMTGVSAITYRN